MEEAAQWREVAVLSGIKGYHFFKVRPQEGNRYDENAMKVMMPESVTEALMNAVTRKADAKRKEQRMKDVIGKQVGRLMQTYAELFVSFQKTVWQKGQLCATMEVL